MRNYRKMSDDEKKIPRISLAASALAMLGAVLGPAIAQQERMLSILRPVHYHPAHRRGGQAAHRMWKRRRAAGWDR